jgi:hypothetical protein
MTFETRPVPFDLTKRDNWAMKLVPLQQWICDSCREVIQRPEDGWLEWVSLYHNGAHDFRIVHHKTRSPRGEQSRSGCYQHERAVGRKDVALERFAGPDAIAHLLTFLDAGYIDPDDSGPQVKSTRELTELIRRLAIPHYEEARLYWSEAVNAGFFEGANEMSPYRRETLLAIIENFGAADDPEYDSDAT